MLAAVECSGMSSALEPKEGCNTQALLVVKHKFAAEWQEGLGVGRLGMGCNRVS